MARYDGNLAYKLPLHHYAEPARPFDPIEEQRKRRAEAQAALVKRQKARTTYKILSSLRVKKALAVASVVLIAALLIAIPVWRYAGIMEANYANVRIQNEIQRLQRDINVRDGKMLEISDLMRVREKALKSFGMQTQTADQTLSLVTSTRTALALSQLNEALTDPADTIEAYVKGGR